MAAKVAGILAAAAIHEPRQIEADVEVPLDIQAKPRA